jgi:hypothetical protein
MYVCSNVMTAVLLAPFLFILSAISLNCVQRLTEWIASLAKVKSYHYLCLRCIIASLHLPTY